MLLVHGSLHLKHVFSMHGSRGTLDFRGLSAIIVDRSTERGKGRIIAAHLAMDAQKKSVLPATLAALAGNGIFGFSFMFSRIALAEATPFVMLMYRFVIAFGAINVVACWSRLQKKQGWLRFELPWRSVGPLIALGLVQPVLYFLCESYGISLTNATVSGVIIALIPIMALAAGVLFMREKPSWKQVGFSVLSISGVVVMTLQQSAGGTVHPLGVVLLVGAVACGAAFNIMSRKLSGAFSALERTYVMMLIAAVVFTILAVIETGGSTAQLFAPVDSLPFMGSMLYLSLFSSILAFLCLNYAATILPVGKSTAFCNVTTVLSVFAGVVFLGESINAASLIAAVVIIIGVFGVQKT